MITFLTVTNVSTIFLDLNSLTTNITFLDLLLAYTIFRYSLMIVTFTEHARMAVLRWPARLVAGDI